MDSLGVSVALMTRSVCMLKRLEVSTARIMVAMHRAAGTSSDPISQPDLTGWDIYRNDVVAALTYDLVIRYPSLQLIALLHAEQKLQVGVYDSGQFSLIYQVAALPLVRDVELYEEVRERVLEAIYTFLEEDEDEAGTS